MHGSSLFAGSRQDPDIRGVSPGGFLASCEEMSRPDSSRFPVTVTRLPLTRCEICGRTLAYQPGQASAVLTKHYRRMHPEALAEATETTGS
jgi:hypothetical protein